MWDERYGEAELAYGTQPNDFLREQSGALTPGTCLSLAEGQGRNAVWLARHGFAVTAMDQSRVGLARAEAFAGEHGVAIDTVVADLAEYDMGTERWDSIVSIFVHLTPDLRRDVHHRIVAALKPGGTVLLEAYTARKFDLPGSGGPPPAQAERVMDLAMLQEDFAGLDVIIGREVDREVNEGVYHQGLSATVQWLARKPAAG